MDVREDQVIRQREFLLRHPHVTISHHRHPSWYFTAVWYDGGERREVTATELGELIDQLLDAFDAQDPGSESFHDHPGPALADARVSKACRGHGSGVRAGAAIEQ